MQFWILNPGLELNRFTRFECVSEFNVHFPLKWQQRPPVYCFRAAIGTQLWTIFRFHWNWRRRLYLFLGMESLWRLKRDRKKQDKMTQGLTNAFAINRFLSFVEEESQCPQTVLTDFGSTNKSATNSAIKLWLFSQLGDSSSHLHLWAILVRGLRELIQRHCTAVMTKRNTTPYPPSLDFTSVCESRVCNGFHGSAFYTRHLTQYRLCRKLSSTSR